MEQQKIIMGRLIDFKTRLGTPTTVLSRNIGLSVSALTKAVKGELKLSDATLKRISDYLAGFSF